MHALIRRHHAAFHRLLAAATWSIDRVGLAFFDLITLGMEGQRVTLAGDDTLIPRRGLHIFGTGMHRDPQLSSRSRLVIRWRHCWVVLCVRDWTRKQTASFADMLEALRLETLTTSGQTALSTLEDQTGVKKLLDHLINLVALAS